MARMPASARGMECYLDSPQFPRLHALVLDMACGTQTQSAVSR